MSRSVFTIPQAAAELDIPRRTAYHWNEMGWLPVRRLTKGRVVLFHSDVEHVARVIEQHGRAGVHEGRAARPEVAA